jgi:hypothetical protein
MEKCDLCDAHEASTIQVLDSYQVRNLKTVCYHCGEYLDEYVREMKKVRENLEIKLNRKIERRLLQKRLENKKNITSNYSWRVLTDQVKESFLNIIQTKY